ncbi:NUDIX hydrolase [Allorhizobium undicola]|uniref:NUDIX hydrolase n=1 Tax=Allorhizobium undicola TaxID=78527 RepID=UPI003D32EDEC
MFRRPPRQQFGAICYRWNESEGAPRLEVLLITSRDTGRWVIPKGWPMGQKKSHAVAEREAYEEAGVKGKVGKKPYGDYSYDKAMPGGMALPCMVLVFLLEVRELKKDFPEMGARRLEWFSPESAAEQVREPQLKVLLRNLPQKLAAPVAKA